MGLVRSSTLSVNYCTVELFVLLREHMALAAAEEVVLPAVILVTEHHVQTVLVEVAGVVEELLRVPGV